MWNMKSCIHPPKRSSMRNNNIHFLAMPSPQASTAAAQVVQEFIPHRTSDHAGNSAGFRAEEPGAGLPVLQAMTKSNPLAKWAANTTTVHRTTPLEWQQELNNNPRETSLASLNPKSFCTLRVFSGIPKMSNFTGLKHSTCTWNEIETEGSKCSLATCGRNYRENCQFGAGHRIKLYALLQVSLTYHWIWGQEILKIAKNLQTNLQIWLQN